MMMDDYDGQMIFGDLVGLSFLTFVLQMRKNPEKNLTQETCPDRGSNPGPLCDKRACYHLFHSGGRYNCVIRYSRHKCLYRIIFICKTLRIDIIEIFITQVLRISRYKRSLRVENKTRVPQKCIVKVSSRLSSILR